MAKTPSPAQLHVTTSPPLRDQAYALLKRGILSGQFEPGTRLVEREIGNLLGLSRSPVREAFRRLQQEGYLEVSRAGVFVQQVSFKDIQDLFSVRQRLEGLAAALAAGCAGDADIESLRAILGRMVTAAHAGNYKKAVQAGSDFHNQLYTLSGNKYLRETLTALTEQLRRFRSLNVSIPERGQDALKEHLLIVDAVARRDITEADRLAQEHIQHSWEHTRKAFEKNADGTAKSDPERSEK